MKAIERININFYEKYNVRPSLGKMALKKYGWLLPFVLVICIVGAICLNLGAEQSYLAQEILSIQDFVTNPTLLQQYGEIEQLSAEQRELTARLEELHQADEEARLRPTIDGGIITAVNNCAGSSFSITGYNYTAENRVLKLNINTASPDSIPLFVQALRQTNLFDDVVYSGYNSSGGEVYTSEISCAVAFAEPVEGGEEQ